MKRFFSIAWILLLLLLAGCGQKPAVINESTGRGEDSSSVAFSVEYLSDSVQNSEPSSLESQENPPDASQTLPAVSTGMTESNERVPASSPLNPADKGKSTRSSLETEEKGSSKDESLMPEDSEEKTTEAPTAGSRDTSEASSPDREGESEKVSPEETAKVFPRESKTREADTREAIPTAEPSSYVNPVPAQELTGQRLPGVNYDAYLPVPDWAGRGGASPSLAMQYGGYYTKNAEEKVIYITFCMDYENGYTNQMMDTLSSLGVRAAFFITGTYLSKRPDMARSILNRGHLLGSHSYRHLYTYELSDVELINDFVLSKKLFQDTLGYSLRYYRPAYGFIMERDMILAQRFGLTTVMFSFNYADYDLSRQPGKGEALERLKSGLRPGAIYYLHVTPCNIQALPEFVSYAKSQGYSFLRLDESKAGQGPQLPPETTAPPETKEPSTPVPSTLKPEETQPSSPVWESEPYSEQQTETDPPLTEPVETEAEERETTESETDSQSLPEIAETDESPEESEEESESSQGETESQDEEKPPESSTAA